LGDGGSLQDVAILAGGGLAAAIGMMDEARSQGGAVGLP
jgi:hypothetical protein